MLDNDLLIGKPVLLAATAGTARHALVVDDADAPAVRLPAHPDRADLAVRRPRRLGRPGALNKRIDRAAFELVLLMESGFARQVRDEAWQSYQHEFGRAGGTELAIDIDSDLMRLATGGSAGPAGPAAGG